MFLTSHLRDGIRQQGVQLFVGAISDSTPPSWVEVLPDAAQANGHPLAEQRVGVRQLLQAVGYQVALQTGFLERTEETVLKNFLKEKFVLDFCY